MRSRPSTDADVLAEDEGAGANAAALEIQPGGAMVRAPEPDTQVDRVCQSAAPAHSRKKRYEARVSSALAGSPLDLEREARRARRRRREAPKGRPVVGDDVIAGPGAERRLRGQR